MFTFITESNMTIPKVVQMVCLVCFETLVDEIKEILCRKRGIIFAHVDHHIADKPWFSLSLALFGTAITLCLVAGIKADCYFFGP